MLIPPSALMVAYGTLTNSGIGELLIGGIIPGLVFASILGVFIIITSIIYPEKAPLPTEVYTLSQKLWSLRLVVPLLVVIVVMMGGI